VVNGAEQAPVVLAGDQAFDIGGPSVGNEDYLCGEIFLDLQPGSTAEITHSKLIRVFHGIDTSGKVTVADSWQIGGAVAVYGTSAPAFADSLLERTGLWLRGDCAPKFKRITWDLVNQGDSVNICFGDCDPGGLASGNPRPVFAECSFRASDVETGSETGIFIGGVLDQGAVSLSPVV
jgi:hypothetical protein